MLCIQYITSLIHPGGSISLPNQYMCLSLLLRTSSFPINKQEFASCVVSQVRHWLYCFHAVYHGMRSSNSALAKTSRNSINNCATLLYWFIERCDFDLSCNSCWRWSCIFGSLLKSPLLSGAALVVCNPSTIYASYAMLSFFSSPYLSMTHNWSDSASLNNLGMSIFASSNLASLPACGTSNTPLSWMVNSAICGAPSLSSIFGTLHPRICFFFFCRPICGMIGLILMYFCIKSRSGPRVKLGRCKSALNEPHPHPQWFTLLTVLRRCSRW